MRIFDPKILPPPPFKQLIIRSRWTGPPNAIQRPWVIGHRKFHNQGQECSCSRRRGWRGWGGGGGGWRATTRAGNTATKANQGIYAPDSHRWDWAIFPRRRYRRLEHFWPQKSANRPGQVWRFWCELGEGSGKITGIWRDSGGIGTRLEEADEDLKRARRDM